MSHESPISALPAGPRMPTVLQTAIWIRDPQWTMDQCARRFGDTFALRIANQGTWIVLGNPADVEAVFRGDLDVLMAGEGNAILEPVLGSHSLLLLDGRRHLEQRRLMLPAFRGERRARYADLMREVAVAEIDAWPRGEPLRGVPACRRSVWRSSCGRCSASPTPCGATRCGPRCAACSRC